MQGEYFALIIKRMAGAVYSGWLAIFFLNILRHNIYVLKRPYSHTYPDPPDHLWPSRPNWRHPVPGSRYVSCHDLRFLILYFRCNCPKE